jgi:hypothetical protein
MSVQAQPGVGVAAKPALPTALLVMTILLALQAFVRAGFLITTLWVSARFLSNATFLLLSVLVPAILLILTVVMVILIFVRAPAAKPYGITVCALNIVFQLFAVGRFVSLYSSNPRIPINPQFVLTSIAYLTIFTLALIFLARWAPTPAFAATGVTPRRSAAPVGLAGESYRGKAQASLICALCGPLFLVVLGPLALGLGIAARSGMKASGNFDGQGMALTGIIVGSIEIAVMALLVLLAIAMRF